MDLDHFGQTLIITDGSLIYARISDKVRHYAKEWGLEDEFERLYDWLVVEAFIRELRCRTSNHVKLYNFNYHDLYKCVYNDIMTLISLCVREHIQVNNLNLLNCANVKILVTFRELVFVRTFWNA